MGLSSSQARLLSLTGRMHDIEYKAQHLEAQKLQMANESRHVYQEYENALNASTIQVKQIGADGSANFVNATYNIMKSLGYDIKFDELPVISAETERNYITAAGNKDYFIALETGRITETNRVVDGYQEIYTADQLVNFLNNPIGNCRLMSDIDMSGKEWTLKNAANVIFDGNGHKITNLNQVMFYNLTNSNVSNIDISADITNRVDNQSSKALLANYSKNTTISNVSLSGSLKNEDARYSNSDPETGRFMGSLIGWVKDGTKIENCSSSVNIDSESSHVGGLVGCVESNVEIVNCSTSGDVQGTKNVGGLVGHLGQSCNVTIKNCSSNGDITSTDVVVSNAGGLIGYVDYNTNTSENIIKDCSATGDVYSSSGSLSGAGNFIGTIAANLSGPNSYINITNCTGSGTVSTIDGSISENDRFVGVNNASNVVAENSDTASVSITPPHIETTVKVNDSGASNAGAVFDSIVASAGRYTLVADSPVAGHEDDTIWFANYLLEGLLHLFKPSSTGEFYQVNVATDTNLQEVSDPTMLKKAEAKYESDMRRIDAKDKKFDTDLAALDNERNAIKQEMETLKSVAKENVDRTFKLFS